MACFNFIITNLIEIGLHINTTEEFLDNDMEMVRRWANLRFIKVPRAKVIAPELSPTGFTAEMWERIIWWCDHDDKLFWYVRCW